MYALLTKGFLRFHVTGFDYGYKLPQAQQSAWAVSSESTFCQTPRLFKLRSLELLLLGSAEIETTLWIASCGCSAREERAAGLK